MKRRSFVGGALAGLAAPMIVDAGGCSIAGADAAGPDPASKGRATEPSPIADQGYRLIFSDEFDGPLDVGERGYRWCPRLWWRQPAERRQYGVKDSCLYLRLFRDNGWSDCAVTTEWSDVSGGTFFRGGYFEARINCAKAWNAFWLFSVSHSRGIPENTPQHWNSELDILETDSAQPNRFVGTLHSNTASPGNTGPPDQQNTNNNHDMPTPLLGQWHRYAVLWTRRETVWFVDDAPVIRYPAFASSWQDMFLILSLGKGGVNGGPPPPVSAESIEMLVDWVRVWQRPSED
jgi:hypothetical protein